MRYPPEPTGEQCTNSAAGYHCGRHAVACWYPQMGGYAGKAIVVYDDPDEHGSSCCDVYVWHDGEFPFSDDHPRDGEVRAPKVIHHCSGDQFVRFGELLRRLGCG